jgi:hypothetical protein
MATLGSTAEPTTGATYYGLNTTNHFAVLLTMPAGGPWEISRIGFYAAGMNETAQVRGCIWSGSGTLLGRTPSYSLAGVALAIGNSTKVEGDLETPITVAGGAGVYVGFARDPADDTQFSTRSGNRAQWYSSSWPSSFGSWSSVAGAIGAYIADYHSANSAPNAPTSLDPSANEVVNSGTAPVVKGTRSDPDSGDYITAYQVVVYDDNGTTVRYDSGKISVSGSPTSFSRTVSLPSAHKYYKWKGRTWDKDGVAGPYTAQQRFYANAVPSTPGAPTVDTDTLVPTISGTFTDSGDTASAVQIEVGLNATPNTSTWASGDTAVTGTSWSKAYAGTALAWGVAYRCRYRTKDSHGAYSSWSAYKVFTPVQPTGASNMTPRTTNPRLNDLTPDLSIAHSATFRNDEYQVAATEALGNAGTLLKSKVWTGTDYAAVSAKVYTYDGLPLAWGGTYVWRARIELSADGTITAWSPWYSFRMNAEPAGASAMTPANGIVLTDTTPELAANFSDPDLDQGDTPTLVTLEVRNNGTDALVFSQTGIAPVPGVAADGQSYSHVVSVSPALAAEVTYKWRIRFTDAMGLQGAFSPYALFKVSAGPTVTATAPGATVTESTPTLDWAFSSPAGKAQSSYRVQLFDKGPAGAPSYAQAMAALAPWAYYRLGEAVGPVAQTGSAAGGAGTVGAGATLGEPGLLTRDEDTAVRSSGLADPISMSLPALPGAGERTFMAWALTSSGLTTEGFLSSGGTTGYLRFTTPGRVQWVWRDSGGVGRTLSSPNDIIVPGQRYFIVGTHDGVWARLYVNGVEVAAINTWNVQVLPALTTWRIGAYSSAADRLTGVVDEAAVFVGAMSPANIAALYEAGTNPTNYPNEVEVYDSGEVISPATAMDVPFGVLIDGHSYRWQVTAKDTDQLAFTLV